jgi:hypothetical protein
MGGPINDEHIEALARTALHYSDHLLLRAVHTLAPHYKMKFRELPDEKAVTLLQDCCIPCNFCVHASKDNFEYFSTLMESFIEHHDSLITDMELTISQDLSSDGLEKILARICELKIDNLSFTVDADDYPEIEGLDAYSGSGSVGSLTLIGGKSQSSTNTLISSILCQMFFPTSLSLQVSTPGAAAIIVAQLGEQQLNSLGRLKISCATPAIAEEASLVSEIGELIKKPNCMRNILIQSQESLVTDEEKKVSLIRLASSHPLQEDISLEHVSSSGTDWERDLHINFPPLNSLAPL